MPPPTPPPDACTVDLFEHNKFGGASFSKSGVGNSNLASFDNRASSLKVHWDGKASLNPGCFATLWPGPGMQGRPGSSYHQGNYVSITDGGFNQATSPDWTNDVASSLQVGACPSPDVVCHMPCAGSCGNYLVASQSSQECEAVSGAMGCGKCKNAADSEAERQRYHTSKYPKPPETGYVTLCPATPGCELYECNFGQARSAGDKVKEAGQDCQEDSQCAPQSWATPLTEFHLGRTFGGCAYNKCVTGRACGGLSVSGKCETKWQTELSLCEHDEQCEPVVWRPLIPYGLCRGNYCIDGSPRDRATAYCDSDYDCAPLPWQPEDAAGGVCTQNPNYSDESQCNSGITKKISMSWCDDDSDCYQEALPGQPVPTCGGTKDGICDGDTIETYDEACATEVCQQVTGLEWRCVGGTKPPSGTELYNTALSAALAEGKRTFDKAEWDAFGITSVDDTSYIKATATKIGSYWLTGERAETYESYYQPDRRCCNACVDQLLMFYYTFSDAIQYTIALSQGLTEDSTRTCATKSCCADWAHNPERIDTCPESFCPPGPQEGCISVTLEDVEPY